MLNNELSNFSNNKLGLKNIKILRVETVNDFLFIVLNNGQKVLSNGKEVYDVSDFNHLTNLFEMGNKFCAVMTKRFSICLVDLKANEILFEDNKAYHISKQDDRTLHVIMKIGGGNNTIYDLKLKNIYLLQKIMNLKNL